MSEALSRVEGILQGDSSITPQSRVEALLAELVVLAGSTDEETVKGYISEAISDLIDGAPETYDTLKELADWISSHQETYTALATLVASKQDLLTFDQTPTANSTNPVTSGGVKAALDGKQGSLTFDSTPTANSTNPVTSGGVKTALDAKQNTLTFDSAPTDSSTNPVTSGGVKTALNNKQDALTFDEEPTANSTNPVKSKGIYARLKDLDDRLERAVSAYDIDQQLTMAVNGSNTTSLFWRWFPEQLENLDEEENRYDLLDRFFAALALAWGDKTYTIRNYKASVSSDPTMTPLDDLVNKTPGLLCTEASTAYTHWMDEDPMYFYIRANALSKADGTMNVLAIEGETAFDITGETAPVYTFKLAKWLKEWEDDYYEYKSWKTVYADGYYPYAKDVAPDNTKRILTWTPTFPGGLAQGGGLTSGAGIAPYIFASASDGNTKAKITSDYEGLWNDCDTISVLHDWQFRHFNLENSGILEGCTNYNLQYTVAASESSVKRVLLTTANGANFVAGSAVCVGDPGSSTNYDRGQSHMRNIVSIAKISSIESVTVDGTTYTALNLDVADNFTTTATTKVSSIPWFAGSTEDVPGHADGCLYNLTNGKTPIRVGGVEMMDGAYAIGLDPLYNVTAATDGVSTHKDYAIYECRNSEKLATSITNDYVSTGLSLANVVQGWSYVKSFIKTRLGILFPNLFDGVSTSYYKSAFYGTGSAGVRCPWRFASLSPGGSAGLACEFGDASPALSGWHSRPRLCGSGKKRGEWTA